MSLFPCFFPPTLLEYLISDAFFLLFPFIVANITVLRTKSSYHSHITDAKEDFIPCWN